MLPSIMANKSLSVHTATVHAGCSASGLMMGGVMQSPNDLKCYCYHHQHHSCKQTYQCHNYYMP